MTSEEHEPGKDELRHDDRQPAEPDQPGQGDQGAEPSQPSQPGQPSQGGQGGQGGQRDQGDQPVQDSSPGQPDLGVSPPPNNTDNTDDAGNANSVDNADGQRTISGDDIGATVQFTPAASPAATAGQPAWPPLDATISQAETVLAPIGQQPLLPPLAPSAESFAESSAESPDQSPDQPLDQSASDTPTVRPGGLPAPLSPRATVMSSGHIDRTIVATDLNADDAAAWNQLATHQFLAGATRGLDQSSDLPRDISPTVVSRRGGRQTGEPISATKLNLRVRQLQPLDESAAADPDTTADYRLVRLLGKGGMGNVYVARQESLGRTVALKIIQPLDQRQQDRLATRGQLEKTESQRRSQFLSEAIVTGDLEHPNIVPIHDVAMAEDQTLFYSMKCVVGTPWHQVIAEKSRDENIEILLKVCDAIGFAHTRGIVHRDIKPENIMLGDFGIVMVMDWGLALAKPGFEKIDSIQPVSGLGGSPAYMAPEMATGPLDSITSQSDIYLLGATLFQIVTGQPPHNAPNISECLRAVATNKIREIQPKHQGELMDIALRAMATRPSDRYPDVPAFQQAIREYRSHSESISLCAKANESLAQATRVGAYNLYARAIFGFEEAIALWKDNGRAWAGLESARQQYADTAFENGDFDLCLSLLREDETANAQRIEQVRAAQQERLSRQARLKTLRYGIAALLGFILVGSGISLYLINDRANAATEAQQLAEHNARESFDNFQLAEANAAEALTNLQLAEANFAAAQAASEEALQAKELAEQNAQVAIEQQNLAEQAQGDAERQQAAAEASARRAQEQETEARNQQAEAERQREIAEYESYVSRIHLIKARIERNEFDDARRMLQQLHEERGDQSLGWEWHWLSRLTRRSADSLSLHAVPIDLAHATDGHRLAVVLEDGSVRLARLDDNGQLNWQTAPTGQLPQPATAIAISPDQQQIAIGTSSGLIEIWDADLTRRQSRCHGHDAAIGRLQFTDSGLLVSGSDDGTARFWRLPPATTATTTATTAIAQQGQSLAVCWHLAPVADLAVASIEAGQAYRLVTAFGQSVQSWRIAPPEKGNGIETGTGSENVPANAVAPLWQAKSEGQFRRHQAPVTAVAVANDGSWMASGDNSGTLYRWQPQAVRPLDYPQAVAAAVQRLTANQPPPTQAAAATATAAGEPNQARAGSPADSPADSAADASVRSLTAHADAVRSIQISADQQRLLTASDDYTIALWQAGSLNRIDTLRGHGGWVRRALFVNDPRQGQTSEALSIGNDQTIRYWKMTATNTLNQPLSVTDTGHASEVGGGSGRTSDSTDGGGSGASLSLTVHQAAVTSVRFDSSGTRLVTTSADQTARRLSFDPATQRLTSGAAAIQLNGSLAAHPLAAQPSTTPAAILQEGSAYAALALAVDPHAGRLFIASADSVVRIWDLEHTVEVAALPATGLLTGLSLSQDGRFLVTGSSDPAVSCVCWDLGAGHAPTATPTPLSGHAQVVTCAAISPDGRWVFAGDRGGIGILWDRETAQPVGARWEQLRGYRLNAAAFSGDSQQLYLAADDGQISVIQVATGEVLRRMPGDGAVVSLSLSADRRWAAALAEQPTQRGLLTTVHLYDLTSGWRQRLAQRLQPAADQPPSDEQADQIGRLISARFGVGGNRLAVGYAQADERPRTAVQLWQIDSLSDIEPLAGFRFPAEIGPVQAVLPLAPGRLLSLAGAAGYEWDLPAESHVRSFRTSGRLTQASFSPDGRAVLTVSQALKIWDSETGQALLKHELPHQGPVHSGVFSPQPLPQPLLATAGEDGVVKLWQWSADQASLTELRQWALSGPPRPVRRLAFSPDGQWLAAVGDRGLVRLWRPADDRVIELDDSDDEGGPAAAQLTSAAFDPSGHWLAVGGSDSLARIWPVDSDAATGQPPPPVRLVGHADRIEDICFLGHSSGQLRVLTASRDKTARLWDPRLNSRDRLGRELLSLADHRLGVTGVAIDPTQRTVVTSSSDGTIRLWPTN